MIKFGISEQSVIPVRNEPSERAEMITQVLFGETFQIVEETVKWSYVKLTNDNYIGWIDNKTITAISEEYFKKLNTQSHDVSKNLFINVFNHNNEQILLPAGSILPNLNKEQKTFLVNENKYYTQDEMLNTNKIEEISKQFVNSPYLWGGKNPFGIDCSGFTQVIYSTLGKLLPRDANQQVNEGSTVNFISDIQAGDLAFFDDIEGNIIHVGIVLNAKEIIHASGKVRIDNIDQQGIFNKEIGKYTHRLRVIKRLL
jgi:hypothetical protein